MTSARQMSSRKPPVAMSTFGFPDDPHPALGRTVASAVPLCRARERSSNSQFQSPSPNALPASAHKTFQVLWPVPVVALGRARNPSLFWSPPPKVNIPSICHVPLCQPRPPFRPPARGLSSPQQTPSTQRPRPVQLSTFSPKPETHPIYVPRSPRPTWSNLATLQNVEKLSFQARIYSNCRETKIFFTTPKFNIPLPHSPFPHLCRSGKSVGDLPAFLRGFVLCGRQLYLPLSAPLQSTFPPALCLATPILTPRAAFPRMRVTRTKFAYA